MKSVIKNLVEQRAALWTEMSGLLDGKTEMSAEDTAAFAQRSGALDNLDARIETLSAQLERSAKIEAARSLVEDGIVASEKRGTEAAKSDAAELRGLLAVPGRKDFRSVDFNNTFTATEGKELVHSSYSATLIAYLTENSAFLAAGPNVITTTDGADLILNRKTDSMTAQIVGEGQTINKQKFHTDSLTLRAFKYAVMTEYSPELGQDAAVDVLSLIVSDHGDAIANTTGRHFLVGTGTGQPLGLFTAATAGVTLAAGKHAATDVKFGDLVALQHSVKAPYRVGSAWLSSNEGIAALRATVDNEGRPLYAVSYTEAGPATLLGAPVLVQPDAPAAVAGGVAIGYGSVKRAYTVRNVGTVRVDSSKDVAFENDLISVRTIFRTDGTMVDASAFKTLRYGS